jgi:hypothetical protein
LGLICAIVCHNIKPFFLRVVPHHFAGMRQNLWELSGKANVFMMPSNVLKNSKTSSTSVEFNLLYS